MCLQSFVKRSEHAQVGKDAREKRCLILLLILIFEHPELQDRNSQIWELASEDFTSVQEIDRP